jgi:hypothetical protein
MGGRPFPAERHGRDLSRGRADLRRAVGIDVLATPATK